MADEQAPKVPDSEAQTETPPEGKADDLPEWVREKLTKANKEAARYRTEAKANADAVKRLAEIEEAQKSEEQKVAERLAAAEKRAAELEQRATLATVAADTGVSLEILSGPADNSEEAVRAYAQLVADAIKKAGEPRAPKLDPLQGVGASAPPIPTSPGLGTLRAAYEANTH